VLRDGRTTIFVEGEVRNTDGELVAKATGTVRARPGEKG
jgi:acyl-coenzyme A thioesterase PaaI-like protein